VKRRTFFGAAGGAGLLSLAGCTAVASQSTLDNPTVERENDGETHLIYKTDQEELATVTIQPGRKRYAGSGDGTLPVDVSLWHRNETKIESLRLKLRAPPSGAGVPAQIALTTPPWNPHPSIQFYTNRDNGEMILEIDEMEEQGDGTMTFEFILTDLAASVSELRIDVTAQLTENSILGETSTIEGRTQVPLPDNQ
jgi:hypothetical protein